MGRAVVAENSAHVVFLEQGPLERTRSSSNLSRPLQRLRNPGHRNFRSRIPDNSRERLGCAYNSPCSPFAAISTHEDRARKFIDRRASSRARISCAIHNLRGRFTVDGRPGRFRGFIARGHPRCLTHRPTPPRKQLGLASKIGRCINKRQRRGNRDGDSARGRERERQKSMKNGKAQKRAEGKPLPLESEGKEGEGWYLRILKENALLSRR